MTQLVLGVQANLLLPLAYAILAGLKGLYSFFKGLGKSLAFAIAVSRQAEANRKIAFFLRHEYPNLSVEQIISELNAKTIEQLRKEFGNA